MQRLESLAAIIPRDRISTDAPRLDELSWDALSESRIHPLRRPDMAVPLCAVNPKSTEEVRQLVLYANREKIPLTPYGGGSGLMGGALSVRPGIVVDFRSMNDVIEIDTAARTVRAQAGIVLEALDERLNTTGHILGHDPWTVPVATLGGAISTNSLGYRGGIYGSMGEQVLGLEAVLGNGEILRTRAVGKSSAGINLNALMIGGEGCFGIVTEAVIRIFPSPETRLLNAVMFSSFEAGFETIQEMFSHRLTPALLDFGDDDEHCEGGAVLYLGFEGNREVVEVERKLALRICAQAGARELPVSYAESFWRDRHVIARNFAQNRRQRRERGKDGLYRDWIHVALPASRVLRFRAAAREIISRRGVQLHESGLWVQPELFSLRLGSEEPGRGGAQLALQSTVDELLQLVQQMGGSMEYTHGVGIKLSSLMPAEHGYGLEIMRQLKKTLDPNNILNPGKLGL